MMTTKLVFGTALAALLAVPSFVFAQTASFPTSNPNAQEWALINLTPATVTSANGGAGVIVGLYDGLTDCRDTDLAGRCTNVRFSTGRYGAYDNHGTHTAGTIAGSRYGQATRATIVNYAVFDTAGYVAGGGGLANAWLNAASRGASIASMSFGCTGRALCFSTSELRAMAGSTLSGTLFVKAAGNDGVALPNEASGLGLAESQAAVNRLLLVGSVNLAGTISNFSNRPGDGCLVPVGATACVSGLQWRNRFIVAPGQSIYATLPDNQYGYMSGTSMATPIVAGAAALLEARWPSLRSQPATVANILLNSATDLGAPGTDAVYGRGLLNVGRAFQNYGVTNIVSPTGALVAVSGTSVSTPPVFGKTAAILSGVTAYDAYGRDYRIGELSNFHVRRGALQMFGVATSPVVDMGRHNDWVGAFFAPPEARSFAGFGPDRVTQRGFASLDQSLRAGVDAPLGGGAVSLRLTGSGDVRGDLSADPALRPLSFFASSDLISQSALANVSLPLGGHGRLMIFGAATLGGQIGPASFGEQLAQPYLQNVTQAGALALERTPLQQSAFGVGYWMQPDRRTVIGFTASTMTQRHGLYDLSSDIAAFDGQARLVNFGLAASRTYGDWDVFGAAEYTSVRAPKIEGPVRFTDGALVSAELGVRRAGLFFRGTAHDDLALTVRGLPQGVSGGLELSYLAPTPDGLDTQTINTRASLAEITGRTVRFEASYGLVSGDAWSIGIAGGADLSGAREAQLMARGRLTF